MDQRHPLELLSDACERMLDECAQRTYNWAPSLAPDDPRLGNLAAQESTMVNRNEQHHICQPNDNVDLLIENFTRLFLSFPVCQSERLIRLGAIESIMKMDWTNEVPIDSSNHYVTVSSWRTVLHNVLLFFELYLSIRNRYSNSSYSWEREY